MKHAYWSSLLFCLLVLAGGNAAAETVKIPVGQQAPDMRDLEVPKRGMSKGNVESEFGSPLTRSQAVGQPPISYWEFEHYFVYFESDRVLHTVFKPTGK